MSSVLTETYSSSEEESWIRNSPIEELVMSDSSVMRTGFRAKKGDLYNSLMNIQP
jgi:hypothetical protein